MSSTLRNDLLADLSLLEKAGQQSVSTASLREYLETAEGQADLAQERKLVAAATLQYQHDMEAWKHQTSRDLEVWKHEASQNMAGELAMFKSVDDAGSTALKATMTINGGAAIALLAFLGNALAKQDSGPMALHLQGASYAMMTFFFGTGFAGLAYGARYLTQHLYSNEINTAANLLNALTIMLAIFSLGCFFWGGWSAHRSFS
ncbi:hypothetical protein [Bordetella avium]|uniref:hypothetical protein n=1 Tax=Bordetella avium TaxID=521 RepID=UPI000E680AD8|nr:hypothetical protein [Bordetella avium]RIQ55248.1 hypothetical protein D0841_16980 [Bordetella avium]